MYLLLYIILYIYDILPGLFVTLFSNLNLLFRLWLKRRALEHIRHGDDILTAGQHAVHLEARNEKCQS